ncbi:hypothetical protein JRF84_08200 [Methylobacterium organophilum]|uniref:hypothetical protein n=1 Tax=Methylobacterium TaxID=407 RepID=UPI0019D1AB8F|nr:hypothetical protein [Methylobacterium organophilum]MBN6819570.1 hypothetical protein [Methylobacterium organophilum]
MRPTFDMLSSTSIVPWRPPEPEPEPTNAVSSTTAEAPAFDLGTLLKLVDELTPKLELIGHLRGFPIYVDRTLPGGEVVAIDPSSEREVWRVSVRSPLIAETKIGAAARSALEGRL